MLLSNTPFPFLWMSDFTAMKTSTKRRSAPLAVTALLASTAFSAPALADAPNVVTSIKPVHSIAAAVMDGVGTPHILIDGSASPHGFALKPSQAFVLQGADAIFWIGAGLSASLEKPIDSMASKAVRVELMDATGIEHLGIREGDQFEGHDHDHGSEEHGHEDHEENEHAHEKDHADTHDHDKDHEKEHAGGHDHDDDHKHEEEHAHDDHDKDHEEEHADGHKHDDHDDHDKDHAHGHDHGHDGERDAHIWLNPENGIAIAKTMAATLSELDPENAKTYQANAEKFEKRIAALDAEISGKLEAVKDGKFIVFHDAYHHFEHHYDVEASGSITVTPEALSSADRIAEIQNRVRAQDITCVFQEPQFDSKLVGVIIEGSDAKVGTLDPLGTGLKNGPDLYPALLTGIADAMVDCLK